MAEQPVDVEPAGENVAGEFGMPADQVADRFLGPVLVAQREPVPDDEGSAE